jgi:hypothetical protein
MNCNNLDPICQLQSVELSWSGVNEESLNKSISELGFCDLSLVTASFELERTITSH